MADRGLRLFRPRYTDRSLHHLTGAGCWARPTTSTVPSSTRPTRRDGVASPVEIAALVVHLFSDEAAFVTGAALPIDGGATAG